METHALLTSKLDQAAVVAHYSAILERSGWQGDSGGVDGALTWRRWVCVDQQHSPWHGTLLVTRHPRDSETYILGLYVERTRVENRPGLFAGALPLATITPEQSRSDQLLRLGQRLLTDSVAYDEDAEDLRLFPGSLPEQLTDLPLPEGMQLVGGMSSRLRAIAILDSTSSAEDLLHAYGDRVLADGWAAYDTRIHHARADGGFASAAPRMRLAFGRTDGRILLLQASPRPGGAELRVDMQTAGGSNQYRPRSSDPRETGLVPYLLPPAFDEQYQSGSSTHPTSVRYSATLRSRLALPIVLEHYADQIAASGWRRVGQREEGALGWHTWLRTYQGQEWTLLFYALRRPDQPGTYVLQLEGNIH